MTKNWHEQLRVCCRGGNLSLLFSSKIDNHARLADCVINFANRVGDKSAVWLMESTHLQQSRTGNPRWLIGKLDPIPPFFARRTDRAEFVNAAQRRVRLSGRQLCAHSPDVDPRAALFHIGDCKFVEIT